MLSRNLAKLYPAACFSSKNSTHPPADRSGPVSGKDTYRAALAAFSVALNSLSDNYLRSWIGNCPSGARDERRFEEPWAHRLLYLRLASDPDERKAHMKTRMHGLQLAAQLDRVMLDLEALRHRVGELGKELQQLQHRCDGQIYRLANRVAHLETAVPACQVHNGS